MTTNKAPSYFDLFHFRSLLTPLNTMIPAVFAKTVSCIDPWIYASGHPRYREELSKRVPWMGINDTPNDAEICTTDSRSITTSTTQEI